MTEHGAAAAVEILPVPGLPEFRPGDDVAAAIAACCTSLRYATGSIFIADGGRHL